MNNFGDLVGPWVVGELLRRRRLDAMRAVRSTRLLAAGSILHLAADGDVVWGAGFNGKSPALAPGVQRLDVRAVRGPRTRDLLLAAGLEVPEIYGDPGALVGRLWDRGRVGRPRPLTVVPNLNDARDARRAHPATVRPRTTSFSGLVATIAASSFVTGSSLHAIVVAESFGIPARLTRSAVEPTLKYEDYYRGTGRPGFRAAVDVEEALALGGEPPAVLDPRLVDAFPADLWEAST